MDPDTQLTPEDIEPLIDLLKTNGGEIGIQLIRDASNRGLVRVRIDAAPDEPKLRQRTGRPYDDLRQAREYLVEQVKWEQLFQVTIIGRIWVTTEEA